MDMKRERRAEAKRIRIGWRRDGKIGEGVEAKGEEEKECCGGKEMEKVRMRREHGERRRQRMGRERTEMEKEE